MYDDLKFLLIYGKTNSVKRLQDISYTKRPYKTAVCYIIKSIYIQYPLLFTMLLLILQSFKCDFLRTFNIKHSS